MGVRRHRSEEGVSELVGAMLLLGLTVIGVALVGIVFLSAPQPDAIPRAAIAAGVNETGSLVLVHDGGDPLKAGDYRIYVDTGSGLVDGTDTFTGLKDGAWSVGGSLVHNGPTPERVVVTAVSGGSETILAEPEFRGGNGRFSPDPVGPGVAPVVTVTPTPTPEDVIINLPKINESLIALPKKATIDATITLEQASYAHITLYNYDAVKRGENNPKITVAMMTSEALGDLYTSEEINLNGFTTGDHPNDRIAVVIIIYDSNDDPLMSITTMGVVQSAH